MLAGSQVMTPKDYDQGSRLKAKEEEIKGRLVLRILSIELTRRVSLLRLYADHLKRGICFGPILEKISLQMTQMFVVRFSCSPVPYGLLEAMQCGA